MCGGDEDINFFNRSFVTKHKVGKDPWYILCSGSSSYSIGSGSISFSMHWHSQRGDTRAMPPHRFASILCLNFSAEKCQYFYVGATPPIEISGYANVVMTILALKCIHYYVEQAQDIEHSDGILFWQDITWNLKGTAQHHALQMAFGSNGLNGVSAAPPVAMEASHENVCVRAHVMEESTAQGTIQITSCAILETAFQVFRFEYIIL